TPWCLLFQYCPVKAGSVPFSRVTWYASAVNSRRHSPSLLATLGAVSFAAPDIVTALRGGLQPGVVACQMTAAASENHPIRVISRSALDPFVPAIIACMRS